MTITLSSAGQADLHARNGFGGTDANAAADDGIDVNAGFLKDGAGNSSDATAVADAAIALNDTARPELVSITAVASKSGVLKAGDTITYTASLASSESTAVNSAMRITLSNDKTVSLVRDDTAPSTLTGTYTIAADDLDSDGLSVTAYARLTTVDESGNPLVEDTTVSGIDQTGSLEVDTTDPFVSFGKYNSTDSTFNVVFNETLDADSKDGVVTALQALSEIDDSESGTWSASSTSLSITTTSAITSDPVTISFDITDLAGNTVEITEIDIV